MPNIAMSVVELPLFLRQAAAVWSDAERAEFVDYIARHPESGDVIPQTGGVRKLRWGRQGSGKRGGARVMYFFHNLQTPVFLIMVYAKAAREDMTPDQKKSVTAMAATLKYSFDRKG